MLIGEHALPLRARLMKRALVASVSFFAATLVATANAQDDVAGPSFFDKSMVAPDRAFELNVAAGYNQAWGDLTDSASTVGQTFGREIQDVAGAGLALELDLGFRSTPRFGAGLYGTLAFFSNQTDIGGTQVRSLSAGVQGTWFTLPFRAFSPWLTLGSGYRGFWIIPDVGGNTRREGWEAVRLQLGTDFRLTKEAAISPYVGGDLNVMFSESLPDGSSRSLSGPPVFFTFTAGILARFDAGGTFAASNGRLAPLDAMADRRGAR
jgi:hypothetical protein